MSPHLPLAEVTVADPARAPGCGLALDGGETAHNRAVLGERA
ncbi:hypothetical protein [Streptomyces sp. NBC_00690]|nr:hypothetical protein [Streptomyces sp. NBC_00690]